MRQSGCGAGWHVVPASPRHRRTDCVGRGRLGAQAEGEGLQGFPGVAGVPASSACRPQSFAKETLRTLCLACKEVDEEVYEEWWQRHQEASILLQNRAQALHQVYEEMEQSLQVGGARGRAPHPSPTRELGPCSVCPRPLPPPHPSSWEPQPSRTGSRTVSSKPSSVSSRGTSKCGSSQGTSKVGPRVATPSAGRREAREGLTSSQSHRQALPVVLSSL